MTEEERRFLCRLLLECGKARTTKTVRFGTAEEAFYILGGAGGKRARQAHTARESIEYVELQIGRVLLTAQISVKPTEEERASIASGVRP